MLYSFLFDNYKYLPSFNPFLGDLFLYELISIKVAE